MLQEAFYPEHLDHDQILKVLVPCIAYRYANSTAQILENDSEDYLILDEPLLSLRHRSGNLKSGWKWMAKLPLGMMLRRSNLYASIFPVQCARL